MRCALLLYVDPSIAGDTAPQDADAELRAYAAITQELAEAGVFVGGEALMPASTGRVVEVHEGRRTVSPVTASSRELAGFYLVDCEEQQAMDIAARMPVAAHGAVEVRPIMAFPAQHTG